MELSKLEKIIFRINVKIWFSLIAFLVLSIFFNGLEEFGIPQSIVVFILHILSLYLLSSREVQKVKIVLWLGMLWNIGLFVYVLYYTLENSGFIDINASASVAAGLLYLAITFIVNLVKLNKYS